MKINRGIAATVGAVATLAVGTPAVAHHNEIEPNLVILDCTLTAAPMWVEDTHQNPGVALVVRVGDQVWTAGVGETLEITIPAGTEMVDWRVWGQGERGVDYPAAYDVEALVKYVENGGDPLGAEVPGVAWASSAVPDCPIPVDETGDATPSAESTVEPSISPSGQSTPVPSETPNGQAGEALPETGVRLPVLISGGALFLGLGAGLVLFSARRKGASLY